MEIHETQSETVENTFRANVFFCLQVHWQAYNSLNYMSAIQGFREPCWFCICPLKHDIKRNVLFATYVAFLLLNCLEQSYCRNPQKPCESLSGPCCSLPFTAERSRFHPCSAQNVHGRQKSLCVLQNPEGRAFNGPKCMHTPAE